jgi:hypothetical protein
MLADPQRFPNVPRSGDERALLALKERLNAVLANQKLMLEMLSETAYSNASNDLASQGSPIEKHFVAPARMTMPEYLRFVEDQTAASEAGVAPAVGPLVAACK